MARNGHGLPFTRPRKCHKYDMFAYNPNYEWTSYKTVVGMVLSVLASTFIVFYIVLTTRDYIVRPPELVSQGDIDLMKVKREIPFDIPHVGIRVGYVNTSNGSATDGRITALENENPYVRYTFQHVVMKDQQEVNSTTLPLEKCIVSSIPSLCPNSTSLQLLGTFYKQDYQFLRIEINKCVGEPQCAPLSAINRFLDNGELRIRAQVSLESEQFDVEQFHLDGSGRSISNRSFEYFGLPNIEVRSDLYFQARTIAQEQRYLGSPPLPETMINLLTFQRRETDFAPRESLETNLMSFVVRLSDSVRLEEVSYWCPSILDLFGLWGAMASFAGSLSLGFIAMHYNKWHFHRHFRKAARHKRLMAQRQTLAAMEFVRKTGGISKTFNREEMYGNLQAQYDMLRIEPDIRLFETHHFNDTGRMAVTSAELKYPTTAFGELRRLAILEHGKKKRAAQFLSLWYGRHLVRKGFITDKKRRRELFAPSDVHMEEEGEITTVIKRRWLPFLRRRTPFRPSKEEQTESSSPKTTNSSTKRLRFYDAEANQYRIESSGPSEIESSDDCDGSSTSLTSEQRRALEAIAEMDFAV